MSDAPLMLGVSGLRGIVGQSLTPEVATRFAAAFGAWLADRTVGPRRHEASDRGRRPLVVVGADGRAGWEIIHRAAIDGLTDAGCDVCDLGIAMTPTVGVVADRDWAAGGMVVTASHNPQEWNGLKCLVRERPADWLHGQRLPPDFEKTVPLVGVNACAPDARGAAEIIDRYLDPGSAPAAARGRVIRDDRATTMHATGAVAPLGMDQIHSVRARRFRVVLDSVNGAGRFAGRELLVMGLGCELRHVGADATGLFPHPPEPTRENLVSLGDAVRAAHADIGFAQDPDADRLAIVDERGQYIGEEYTLALAAESLLGEGAKGQGGKGAVGREPVLVANLSTSRMLDDIALRHGARVVRTPVGEANVVEAMKREAAAGRDVILGGEGNGGVIWPRVTYVRDSLSAMALVLALMARTGRKVSELVASLPAYAIEKRKVELARRADAAPGVQRLIAWAAGHAGARVDTQDGARIDWPERRAWLHVRPSNTEPILRLIAEAPTAPEATQLLDKAAGVIA